MSEDQLRQPEQGVDYYWEGPYMVFTEAWHLKRGYCCKSFCRHCPYGLSGAKKKNANENE